MQYFRAEFPDPPSYNQQREQHYRDNDYDVFDAPEMSHAHESRRHESRDMGHQQMRHQSRDVRSQSEYKISSNPKEGLGQRAQSSPDETELYSEITVCMSQVIYLITRIHGPCPVHVWGGPISVSKCGGSKFNGQDRLICSLKVVRPSPSGR